MPNEEERKRAKQKMASELKEAKELLETWSNDPEKVFVKYGVAENEQEVEVKFASSRQLEVATNEITDRLRRIRGIPSINREIFRNMLGGGGVGPRAACACACIALLVEFEFEE